MITIYQKTLKDSGLKKLKEFRTGSWIYVEDPSEEEIKELSWQYELEEGHITDALDANEVPRLEVEKEATYIFSRAPYSEGELVFTAPFLFVMGENFVLTVTKRPLPIFDRFLNKEIDFYTTQKIKLFIQLFSETNAHYLRFLTTINRSVRGMAVKLEKIENKHIVQLVGFERILNDFLAALIPTNTILTTLLSGKSFNLFEEDEDLVEDLQLSNGQLIEGCRSILKNIVNIREAYSTIMTNNLNRVIKLFTALTVILTIPTIIASIYGMNVALPFAENPFAFLIVLGIIMGISAVLLAVFIKNKWL